MLSPCLASTGLTLLQLGDLVVLRPDDAESADAESVPDRHRVAEEFLPLQLLSMLRLLQPWGLHYFEV